MPMKVRKRTPAELHKRDAWRNRECAGCRSNYYNYPKGASPRGDVAVADDYCCWSLEDAKRDRRTGLATCNTSIRR